MQPTLQKMMVVPQPPGMPQNFVKAQSEMQQKMQDVIRRYWGVNVGTAILNLGLAACLLVGGIMTLQMNAKGRSFLVAMFVVIIVFEIVRRSLRLSCNSTWPRSCPT